MYTLAFVWEVTEGLWETSRTPLMLVYTQSTSRVLFAGKMTNAAPLKLAEGHILEMTQIGT